MFMEFLRIKAILVNKVKSRMIIASQEREVDSFADQVYVSKSEWLSTIEGDLKLNTRSC